MEEHRILCTIHMDPIVTDDERVSEMRNRVSALVREIDDTFTIHDFRFVVGPTHTNLIFDVVVPFEVKTDPVQIRHEIERRVAAIEGKYYAVVTVDRG